MLGLFAYMLWQVFSSAGGCGFLSPFGLVESFSRAASSIMVSDVIQISTPGVLIVEGSSIPHVNRLSLEYKAISSLVMAYLQMGMRSSAGRLSSGKSV